MREPQTSGWIVNKLTLISLEPFFLLGSIDFLSLRIFGGFLQSNCKILHNEDEIELEIITPPTFYILILRPKKIQHIM